MPKEPPTRKRVSGIGEVIISESEFSDFDEVDADRLSDRMVDSPDPDEQLDAPPDDGGDAEWSDKPWMRGQGEKHPHSVKEGPPVTETLSLPADLTRWNEIQAASHSTSGPSLALIGCDREFHAGVWHLYVTYSKLSYQKI